MDAAPDEDQTPGTDVSLHDLTAHDATGHDATGHDDPTTIAGPALVAAIREQVLGRPPVDARERTSIEAFVQQLDRLERPFDERADRVHVTASAIVVGDRGVVLHRHKRLGLWLQPGGHIESGETPWAAALREATEETGLPLRFAPAHLDGDLPRLVHVDVHPGPRKHLHLDLRYVLESPPVAPAPPAGESQEVRWFAWYQAIDLADPGLEGVLRSLQPGQPIIRAGRANDASDLAKVYLRSREFGLPDVPVVHGPSEVRRWFADEVLGHAEVTVAEVDGTVVALLVLEPGHGAAGRGASGRGASGRGASGWIEQLYVDPAWIGRGIGRRLLDRALQRFPEGVQLWTFQSNTRARAFYEAAGFTVAELTDGRGNEERAPDARYEWTP